LVIFLLRRSIWGIIPQEYLESSLELPEHSGIFSQLFGVNLTGKVFFVEKFACFDVTKEIFHFEISVRRHLGGRDTLFTLSAGAVGES
jgi:hypothetical protein